MNNKLPWTDIRQEEFEDTKGVIRICILKKKTTQWQKEKEQKDKQRYTKHTYKTISVSQMTTADMFHLS
jgi:hypothetical protein